ncbi:hypothetical protein Avbf_16634 [Armadillidium vulgare]|nr:hypothetical protein Avbf_16634 [Armadillidium vulgare]
MYMVVPLYICRYIIYITNLYNKTFHYISYSDDDDYDEDDRDEINMSAPPFKRSRFSDINPEAELKIIRSGSVKQAELLLEIFIPAGQVIQDSILLLICLLQKTKEEFTPVTSKYFTNTSRFDNQKDEDIVQMPVTSSFRFMPTVTSTAHKSDSSDVISATKRKPLRSTDLTPSKRSLLPPKSPKFDLSKEIFKLFSNQSFFNSLMEPQFTIKAFELTPHFPY